jgi:hypothetical protein
MDSSNDFLQLRKRAIVCCAFAAALSTVSAYILSGGNRIAGFVIIAVQALLIVLAVRYLIMMKRAGKAS